MPFSDDPDASLLLHSHEKVLHKLPFAETPPPLPAVLASKPRLFALRRLIVVREVRLLPQKRPASRSSLMKPLGELLVSWTLSKN